MGAPLIVSVSGSVRSEIIQTLDLPPERVRVVHNGVDTDRYSRDAYPGARRTLESRIGADLSDAVVVLFVGYEFERKRLGVAIQAVAAQPVDNVHLIVAGGASPEAYRQLAGALGVADRVHFMGHSDDVPSLLAACDIFLFPTRYEAASLAILEAAASGLAIVTTDVAMASEVLVDGEDSLLLPNTEDHRPASQALGRLLKDRALRSKLGAAARDKMQNHTWDRVWERYRSLYEELLDAKARMQREAS
jgi:glycosyltransferase involved in cell wall biosynthesis